MPPAGPQVGLLVELPQSLVEAISATARVQGRSAGEVICLRFATPSAYTQAVNPSTN